MGSGANQLGADGAFRGVIAHVGFAVVRLDDGKANAIEAAWCAELDAALRPPSVRSCPGGTPSGAIRPSESACYDPLS